MVAISKFKKEGFREFLLKIFFGEVLYRIAHF
jgi:hypothetical protein